MFIAISALIKLFCVAALVEAVKCISLQSLLHFSFLFFSNLNLPFDYFCDCSRNHKFEHYFAKELFSYHLANLATMERIPFTTAVIGLKNCFTTLERWHNEGINASSLALLFQQLTAEGTTIATKY